MAVDALACAHNRARGVDWPRERRACRLAEGGRLCAAVARPTYSTRFRGAVPPPLDFTRALEHTGVTPPRHRKVVTPYNLFTYNINFNMLPSTSTTSTTSTPAAAAAPRSVPPPPAMPCSCCQSGSPTTVPSQGTGLPSTAALALQCYLVPGNHSTSHENV